MSLRKWQLDVDGWVWKNNFENPSAFQFYHDCSQIISRLRETIDKLEREKCPNAEFDNIGKLVFYVLCLANNRSVDLDIAVNDIFEMKCDI